ncbi:MAG: TlpA family protein disulfide reductase [Chloroflexota bacterium]|nr:TlpA family protein disulfide reductase [Chloroflexota bacterium]
MEIEGTQRDTIADAVASDEKLVVAPRKRTRRRSITIFIVVSVLNVALLALLWSQLLTPAAQPAGQGNSGSVFSGPLVGKSAPNFTLLALGTHPGPKISLADFKGKPVVLNVWQSSCAPCVSEAPAFQATWQHAQSQGIVFLGIDFQDSQSDALSFVQKYGITYTNVVDQDGSTTINYGVTGTPETIFIDQHGVIVGRHAGEMSASMLQQGLQLLAGKQHAS